MFPMMVYPPQLSAKDQMCFGDCININLEDGPYLRDVGPVPEDKISKKFIWASSLDLRVPKESEGDDDEGGDDDDDDDE